MSNQTNDEILEGIEEGVITGGEAIDLVKKEKEKECRFGHMCTSSCGNDYDCPCEADHCCAFSEDVCDRTCDDCFFKDKYKCNTCEDTGVTTKSEWFNENDSVEVEIRCPDCNE